MSKPEPVIIVIFGITGDLAQRKLLPALYHLFKDDLLDERTIILGITRQAITSDELLSRVELCVNEIDKVCDPMALKKVHAALRMHEMNLVKGEDYDTLLTLLNSIEAEQGICMSRLYYLSIPPQMFEPIVKHLGSHGLNASCQHNVATTRLLIEKPFGYDLASAQNLIQETGEWFSEAQLFRIDHYLAKETAQNILAFRAAGEVVEQLWNSRLITTIELFASEKIDIEGRAVFYEPIGALRDFVQSHLLQLLAIVTMALPATPQSDDVHTAKLQLLQAIQPLSEADVAQHTRRGQYEGYKTEVHNPDSYTETYAEVQLHINTPSWENTAITLKTGKALAERRTDIQVWFHSPTATKEHELVFHIQPDEGISLHLNADEDDFTTQLQAVVTTFNAGHHNTNNGHPDAYERVLIDAVRGDHTLFTTSEEVVAAWKVLDTVTKVWGDSGKGLKIYPKGASTV